MSIPEIMGYGLLIAIIIGLIYVFGKKSRGEKRVQRRQARKVGKAEDHAMSILNTLSYKVETLFGDGFKMVPTDSKFVRLLTISGPGFTVRFAVDKKYLQNGINVEFQIDGKDAEVTMYDVEDAIVAIDWAVDKIDDFLPE